MHSEKADRFRGKDLMAAHIAMQAVGGIHRRIAFGRMAEAVNVNGP